MDELIKAINNPNMINDIVNIMTENRKLQKENELLKEELKELKDGIIGIYNNMNALEIINKKELEEDIEELIEKEQELQEIKKEHSIMKQFIYENGLWEKFLNDDRFIEHLRSE